MSTKEEGHLAGWPNPPVKPNNHQYILTFRLYRKELSLKSDFPLKYSKQGINKTKEKGGETYSIHSKQPLKGDTQLQLIWLPQIDTGKGFQQCNKSHGQEIKSEKHLN